MLSFLDSCSGCESSAFKREYCARRNKVVQQLMTSCLTSFSSDCMGYILANWIQKSKRTEAVDVNRTERLVLCRRMALIIN